MYFFNDKPTNNLKRDTETWLRDTRISMLLWFVAFVAYLGYAGWRIFGGD